MSKAKLGIKRRCGSCGTKFYDFNKNPIICPSCSSEFDPEQLLKSRKGRVASKSAAANAEDVQNEADDIIADDEDTADVQNDADELADGDEFVAPSTGDDDEAADVVEDEEFIATLDDEDDEDEAV